MPTLRIVGRSVEDLFKQKLFKILPDAKELGNPSEIDRYERDQLLVSCAPIKGLSRMQVKVREYADEAKEKGKSDELWPHSRQLGDVLRAMVVCGTPEQLWATWRAIRDGFDVRDGNGRVKNNFAPKNTFKPPDMLLNIVVGFDGYGMPVVGEIQLHYRPILELKENEMHLFYEMERAASIAELIPKGGAAPAPAASTDQRVSQFEAKLAEERTRSWPRRRPSLSNFGNGWRADVRAAGTMPPAVSWQAVPGSACPSTGGHAPSVS